MVNIFFSDGLIPNFIDAISDSCLVNSNIDYRPLIRADCKAPNVFQKRNTFGWNGIWKGI